MNNLVIGAGEIGKAVYKVLNSVYGGVYIRDKEETEIKKADILHICIPYTKDFEKIVSSYIELYGAELTIVHSSTKVGTCDALGAVHSPIRGIHPNLEDGIRTFTKYFGGKDAERASKLFEPITEVKCYPEARTTEAMKLWSTTQYGWNIILEKEIHKWCEENGIDFEAVYTEANKTYNKGYTELGKEQFVRPVLKHIDGKVGGHCVIPNLETLGKNNITKIIKELNETYAL